MTHPPITWTPRQQEIADRLQRDLSYAAIAQELGISPHTVRVHVHLMAAKVPYDPNVPVRRRLENYLDAQLHGTPAYTPAEAETAKRA